MTSLCYIVIGLVALAFTGILLYRLNMSSQMGDFLGDRGIFHKDKNNG